jgi:hypothetical protein
MMNFEEVIRTVFTHPFFIAVLVLIAVNTFIGVAASVKTGTFRWDQITEFFRTMVIPLVGGGLMLQLVFWGVADVFLPEQLAQMGGTGVWTIVIGSLLWRFLRHLKVLAPQLVPFDIDPAVNQDTATTSILTTGTGPKAS